MLDAELVSIILERVTKVQRRVASSLRMVLVSNRRAEQCHDPVAGELVDEAFKALDALSEYPEEALHDRAPFFCVELLGQLHRAFHVSEQHGDLLAFAFERAL